MLDQLAQPKPIGVSPVRHTRLGGKHASNLHQSPKYRLYRPRRSSDNPSHRRPGMATTAIVKGRHMKPELKSMTRKELEKLRADIDKALAKVEAREMKAAIAAAEKAAKKHGFSLGEITGSGSPAQPKRKAVKKPAKPGKPKYANPADPSQTWTGKGRRPDWFLEATGNGKSPEDLAI